MHRRAFLKVVGSVLAISALPSIAFTAARDAVQPAWTQLHDGVLTYHAPIPVGTTEVAFDLDEFEGNGMIRTFRLRDTLKGRSWDYPGQMIQKTSDYKMRVTLDLSKGV